MLSAKTKQKQIGIKAKLGSFFISETELGAICKIIYLCSFSFLVMFFAGVPTVYRRAFRGNTVTLCVVPWPVALCKEKVPVSFHVSLFLHQCSAKNKTNKKIIPYVV